MDSKQIRLPTLAWAAELTGPALPQAVTTLLVTVAPATALGGEVELAICRKP
jgi:hypothetical protein